MTALKKASFEFQTFDTAWCPGCGNFGILSCLKRALEETGKDPHEVLMVAGIGQGAKIPQYISVNRFCGLHGRALPVAAAAKIANERLTVIVNTGDGDAYGEGGNHFIHNIRRNVDITHFVHDNQIYGLTKGQASPTTQEGQVTAVQPQGSINMPLNPVFLALAMGAGFVARAFVGDQEQLVSIMKQAILYKGYAFVDILQPCVSFNKINTFADYTRRVYRLPDDYKPVDRLAAVHAVMEFGDRIPTGVFYNVEQPTFHEKHSVLSEGAPLVSRAPDRSSIQERMKEFI